MRPVLCRVSADYNWLSARVHAIQAQRFREAEYGNAEGGGVTWRLNKTVVLVGMMGAGKTAVGQSLARALGVRFRDSDEEIVKAANRTIAEIFERDGEPFFRRKESQVISRLIDERPAGVLSTGGGAFLSEENRRVIAERAVSVWLKADVDLLWSRVRHRTHRPLLRTADPRATLGEMHRAREPHYAQAELMVESAQGRSIEDMTGRLIEALATRPDVLQRK
ncbi:shikimate kinase [Haematobacter missouriensis]|uniref:Shikimate kinase n=1 Tax=Haematobacter missouriensis TaxID=366616 RepID=A0A225DBC5_9RHOB|nr:shikimate kinase [Haematobacter missouriensis]OWJ86084.1 shikimate kinase [Haematobacter missouriensis]